MNKVTEGREAENIIANHYRKKGYDVIAQNYFIRGGEIDVIAENKRHRLFIEVKLVNYTQELYDYITPHKLKTLQKTIRYFQYHHPDSKPIRLDIAFVRGNDIFNIYENVTNN